MTVYTLTLPGGMVWINANSRAHWRRRAEWTRYWRDRACLEAKSAGIPRLDRAHVTVTVHRIDARRFDPGNLAPTAKAIVDGIVDAGVLIDDDRHHLVGPDMRAGDKRHVRQLVVTIEPLETS